MYILYNYCKTCTNQAMGKKKYKLQLYSNLHERVQNKPTEEMICHQVQHQLVVIEGSLGGLVVMQGCCVYY